MSWLYGHLTIGLAQTGFVEGRILISLNILLNPIIIDMCFLGNTIYIGLIIVAWVLEKINLIYSKSSGKLRIHASEIEFLIIPNSAVHGITIASMRYSTLFHSRKE